MIVDGCDTLVRDLESSAICADIITAPNLTDLQLGEPLQLVVQQHRICFSVNLPLGSVLERDLGMAATGSAGGELRVSGLVKALQLCVWWGER